MSIRSLTTVIALIAAQAVVRAQQEGQPAAEATKEKPSAELIIDAEEKVINEPALEPGEEPLPPMDGKIPGEENVFGADLFNASSAAGGGGSSVRAPEIPPPVPVIEDPLETERKMRIRLQKIKARLERDPRLVQLQVSAETSPTPEDYRAARRAYYALFFDKVRRADSSLTDYADKLEKQSLAGLYQTRVEPTWPLSEPPRPQPQARFVPAKQYPASLPAAEEPVRLP